MEVTAIPVGMLKQPLEDPFLPKCLIILCCVVEGQGRGWQGMPAPGPTPLVAAGHVQTAVTTSL